MEIGLLGEVNLTLVDLNLVQPELASFGLGRAAAHPDCRSLKPLNQHNLQWEERCRPVESR